MQLRRRWSQWACPFTLFCIPLSARAKKTFFRSLPHFLCSMKCTTLKICWRPSSPQCSVDTQHSFSRKIAQFASEVPHMVWSARVFSQKRIRFVFDFLCQSYNSIQPFMESKLSFFIWVCVFNSYRSRSKISFPTGRWKSCLLSHLASHVLIYVTLRLLWAQKRSCPTACSMNAFTASLAT